MSAITAPRTSVAPILLVVIAILVVFLAATLAPSQHAVERHGAEAQRAIGIVSNGNPWRHDCKDGRTRIVSYDPKEGVWAVVIMVGDVNITSFTTRSQEYIVRMLEDCGDGRTRGHP